MKKESNFSLEGATISSVHKAMKESGLTCTQLTQMYIDRINKYDKSASGVNSVILINPDALSRAQELDEEFQQNGITKPLHGIPLLLKDNVNTKDMPTTAGSLSLEGVIPEDDAYITKKLTDAGAIIVAKVNLHEFAVWGETASSILGQTLNPYDLTRTPGGSSGGTGAAIAANFGIIGIGTDTINSVRSPASACCLVGLRPTIGLVSRSGIVPYSLTQDTAGPIMRTVEDTAKVLDVISGYDATDPETAWSIGHIPDTYTSYLNKDGLKNKRIGILHSFFGAENIHNEVNNIIHNSLDKAKENGIELIDITENIDADELVNEVSVHLYDLKADLNKYLETLGDKSNVHSLEDIIDSGKYHEGIEDNIKHAQTLDTNSEEYNIRLIKRLKTQNKVMEIMAKYDLDAIVYPHQKRPVVEVGQAQVDRNGVLGSVTGFPSIVVPAGFTKATSTAPLGIPVGIEFLSKEWNEPVLIEIGYAFEQAIKAYKAPIMQA